MVKRDGPVDREPAGASGKKAQDQVRPHHPGVFFRWNSSLNFWVAIAHNVTSGAANQYKYKDMMEHSQGIRIEKSACRIDALFETNKKTKPEKPRKGASD